LGEQRLVRNPVSMSRTPHSVRSPSPEPGEHTDAILSAAGLSGDEIADLRRAGVV